MNGPSDKAQDILDTTFTRTFGNLLAPRDTTYTPRDAGWKAMREAVDAIHDPRLGPDRSVCLRAVVTAIRQYDSGAEDVAEMLEERFGS